MSTWVSRLTKGMCWVFLANGICDSNLPHLQNSKWDKPIWDAEKSGITWYHHPMQWISNCPFTARYKTAVQPSFLWRSRSCYDPSRSQRNDRGPSPGHREWENAGEPRNCLVQMGKWISPVGWFKMIQARRRHVEGTESVLYRVSSWFFQQVSHTLEGLSLHYTSSNQMAGTWFQQMMMFLEPGRTSKHHHHVPWYFQLCRWCL